MKTNVLVNSFGLVSVSRDSLYDAESRYPCFDDKKLISGMEEIETLCPVDPTTGHRDSFENIVKKALDPKYTGLAQRVLIELPYVQSDDDKKNDDAKLDTLVSRLDVGSMAERDAVVAQLSSISDVLFRSSEPAPAPASEPAPASVDISPE